MARRKLVNNCKQQKQLKDIILKLNHLTKNVDALDTNKSYKETDEFPSAIMCGNTETQFLQHKEENSKIKLNVDGAVFYCSRRDLRKYPDTRLGKLVESSAISEILQICDGYTASNNEFLFNKRNANLPDILEFYRTGNLHISSDRCVIAFSQDLEYWGVSSFYLQPCCANKLTDAKDLLENDRDFLENTITQVDQFPEGSIGRMQKKIWNLFENPHSSNVAAVVSAVSMTIILLSLVTLTFKFQHSEVKNEDSGFGTLDMMEAFCISWFVFEFLMRLISCPNKAVFFKQFMNWVDILVIVPYIIINIIESLDLIKNFEKGQEIFLPLRLLRILKPLRFLARIFKLARHSTGMVALGQTLKAKYKELSLVLIFLGVGTIIFGLMLFIAEVELADLHHEGETNRTMSEAYWWAVITMTTVGYGDITPETDIGKGIGTICAIFGVLVVTLPIPIIGNSFDTFYRQEKRRVKLLARNAQDKNASVKFEEDLEEDKFSVVSTNLTGNLDILYSDSVQLNKISNTKEVTTSYFRKKSEQVISI